MFDEGQHLPSPYHRTKFEAERIVRDEAKVPWRVYRPAIVVGDSATGEIDKIDGPYYLFPSIRRLASLPSFARIPAPDLGSTNIVPVDYVADAMDHIIHQPGLDERAFFLVNPKPQPVHSVFNAFAAAAGAPRLVATVGRQALGPATTVGGLLSRVPGVDLLRDVALEQLQLPLEALAHVAFAPTFDDSGTRAALAGTGIAPPPLRAVRARAVALLGGPPRPRPGPSPSARRSVGRPAGGHHRRVVGHRAGSRAPGGPGRRRAPAGGAADRGARGGQGRRSSAVAGRPGCTRATSRTATPSTRSISQMLHDHESVDMLVNNAGRSIRRSVRLSYDRFHDYERTMSLNYFAPVRLILGLLPHMTDRRFGHIVNVSSIGVQANPPRFSAYVASKAALDAFSRVVATETFGDGITFTTIHMPLVRTPMIGPTKLYDRFPTSTPEAAGEMVLKALLDRPKDVSTRLGSVAEVAYAVAPGMVDQVLHVAYRVFPDSAAARGGDGDEGEGPTRAAEALTRLLPGVHW